MIFFLGTTNTSTIIISDRLEGVWDRSIVAGVTSAEILLTHFVTQLLIIIFQSALIMVLTFAIFKYTSEGSLVVITVLIFLQGLCGISYGFLISVFCSDHNSANILSTGVFYPMILTCGLVWPIESMPTVLRWISLCLPFTVPILSVRNVLKKGWGMTHLHVLNGVGLEILWCVILGTISAYQLKKRR
ncbi:ABC transporter G family member 20-like [Agrilus planipennis]|uniref:ABC transporter G family member 20-like n=1 Tax=Agrilus planipennis TaxID=224129 RepID=A0A1W4WQK5_AGRPL|nr:ABC transporter G family member 20-like [Agrilus planipennis]